MPPAINRRRRRQKDITTTRSSLHGLPRQERPDAQQNRRGDHHYHELRKRYERGSIVIATIVVIIVSSMVVSERVDGGTDCNDRWQCGLAVAPDLLQDERAVFFVNNVAHCCDQLLYVQLLKIMQLELQFHSIVRAALAFYGLGLMVQCTICGQCFHYSFSIINLLLD